jgi:hypothetical protein
MNRALDFLADPPQITVADLLEILPIWLILTTLAVLWVPAEAAWARRHKGLDEPRVKTRKTRNPAWEIRRAHRDTSTQTKHCWPVPGGKIVAEFIKIIGGSGTGKTKRILLYIIAYQLRQAQKSLFIVDPKGEIFELLIRLLGKWSQQPLVYLISCLPQHRDEHINPINPMLTEETAQSFLKESIPGEDTTQDTYFDNASQRLGYLVRQAQIRENGGTDVVKVYEVMKDPRELDRLTEKCPDLLGGEWRGSSEPRGPHESNRSTFVAYWSGMELPRIRRIFDTGGEWDFGPKWNERTVTFLCMRPKDAKQAPGLIRATVEFLIGGASEAYEQGGPGVSAMLEEAGTFAPSGQLEIWINLFRDLGVNAAMVMQSPHQIMAKIGRDRAEAMFSSIDATIAGPTSSVADAIRLEEAAGTESVRPPRDYMPLIGWVLYALLMIPGMLISAFLDYRKPPHNSSSNRSASRETVQAHRYPRDYALVNQDDPAKLADEPVRRMWGELCLWLSGKFIMRDGKYLVISKGRKPYLVDARNAYFPGYANQLRKSGGRPAIRWGERAKRPPKPPTAEFRSEPPSLGPEPQPRFTFMGDKGDIAASGEEGEHQGKECMICGATNPLTAAYCTCGTSL